MADWPSAFSSATTSLPRSDCGSASESSRRPICGCASDGGADPDYPASQAKRGEGSFVPVRAAAGLTVDQERDRQWADSARFGDWSKYESAGTFETSRDVRSAVAFGGK